MSKAFTREETEGPELPELSPLLSTLPPGAKNYITPAGAEQLRKQLRHLREEERPKLAQAADDPDARRQLGKLDQKIFRLQQSLESIDIVPPPKGPCDVVTFGAIVTVRERDGEEMCYRIVGVDETDPDRGWVSWLSPIAKALINGRVGEQVRFKSPSGEKMLQIMAIAYE